MTIPGYPALANITSISPPTATAVKAHAAWPHCSVAVVAEPAASFIPRCPPRQSWPQRTLISIQTLAKSSRLVWTRPPFTYNARGHEQCGKIACFHYEISQRPTGRAALVKRAARISKWFAQSTNGQLPFQRWNTVILQSGHTFLSIPTANAVIIDPSTPWFVIPQSLAMSFHTLATSSIPQTTTSGPASTPYSLPCSTALTISLELNGVNLTIPTHDLIAEHRNSAHSGTCISNLRTWVDPGENSFVLGSLFMHRLHVTGSAGECFATAKLHKRHSPENSGWRRAVIGGTIGGIAGAALLAVGAFFLFRLCRGDRTRQRGDRASHRLESVRPTELQPRQQLDSSAKPRPSPPPPAPSSRSPDISIPLQAAAVTSDAETAPTAGPSSWPQLPPHLGSRRTDREVRTSTGSQFTEHFGDIAPDYTRTPKSRSPLGDKPLPHIPFHPPPLASSSQAEGSSRPEPELSFVPFDAHAQTQGTGSSRKSSTSPKNSLPLGAASPVESIGSYKPAEDSHSHDVSI